VVENKAVSIKDIRTAITGCSEKTIQRELANLISQGLIKREGERRWSVYKPV
jgi:predicted HTH transcriptional regulator